MDLLEKLKMVRDEINLLIESEEKKKPFQSKVGKSFQERLNGQMEMKQGDMSIPPAYSKAIEKIF